MSNIRIDARLDKPLEIALPSASASGYEWSLRKDVAALKLLGRRRVANRSAFGAAGRQVFEFEPSERGDFEVTFDLRRPWEDEAVETREFEISVK